MDEVSRDYGVDMSESQTNSLRRTRARSETPRRTLQIEVSDKRTHCPVTHSMEDKASTDKDTSNRLNFRDRHLLQRQLSAPTVAKKLMDPS